MCKLNFLYYCTRLLQDSTVVRTPWPQLKVFKLKTKPEAARLSRKHVRVFGVCFGAL